MFGGLFNQKKYIVQDGTWGTPQPPPQQFQNPYPQQPPPQQMQQPGYMQPAPTAPPPPMANGIGSSMQPEKREEISALSHLDSRATTILTQAQQETVRIQQAFIEPDQILF